MSNAQNRRNDWLYSSGSDAENHASEASSGSRRADRRVRAREARARPGPGRAVAERAGARRAVERRFIDAEAGGGDSDGSTDGSDDGSVRRRRRAPRATAPKFRNYVFTLNNYSDVEVAQLRDLGAAGGSVLYLAFQGERGESGTRHLQGVVCFRNPRCLGGVKNVVGRRAHVEQMRGTADQARDYCRKEESRDPEGPAFCEFGELPAGAGAGRGSRTDCAQVVELLRGGAGYRQIIDAAPSFALRCERGIRAIQSALSGSRKWPTTVYWYHGPTGCGKSRAAFEEAGDEAYVKMPTNKWWDGYEGQANVVIDDYRADFCTFAELLRLFDRYPMRVEYKGGSVQFLARTIWVTTPYSPERTWASQTPEKLDQLMRRITGDFEHPERVKYFGPEEGPLVAGFVPQV